MKDHPATTSLNLEHLTPLLYNRTIRFYIGNRDKRVGTAHTFSLTEKLAEKAYHNRIRSAPIELIIGPSIGYQGHGTSQAIFQEGATWIKNHLL